MSAPIKGQLSWVRILVAVCTCGLSLPFLGIRRRIGASKVLRGGS